MIRKFFFWKTKQLSAIGYQPLKDTFLPNVWSGLDWLSRFVKSKTYFSLMLEMLTVWRWIMKNKPNWAFWDTAQLSSSINSKYILGIRKRGKIALVQSCGGKKSFPRFAFHLFSVFIRFFGTNLAKNMLRRSVRVFLTETDFFTILADPRVAPPSMCNIVNCSTTWCLW